MLAVLMTQEAKPREADPVADGVFGHSRGSGVAEVALDLGS